MKIIITLLFAICIHNISFSQKITQVEYFVDVDNGFGKNTIVDVTPISDGSFPFTVNLSSISAGYHKLYIRSKDSSGNWSQTTRRNIEVLSNTSTPVIVSGEYFIDNDPGFGNASAIVVSPQDSIILQNFTASTASLTVGYHKLYGRLRDNYGRWSQTFRRNIEIIRQPVNNYVTTVEYFIQTDPGFGNGTELPFTAAQDTATHSYNIQLPCLDADSSYNIYLRVKDVLGNWSITTLPNKFALKDSTTITNIKSGLWSDATIWSNNKVPDATTPIVLNHDITVDVNALCKSLIIYCHSVLVNNGKNLMITGQ